MEQQTQVEQQLAQIPKFTLYGLLGCPHCSQAETFLRARGIPALLIIANNDPIIIKGIKEITGQDSYPVLWHRTSNEIIVGFNQEAYERLAKDYFALASAGTSSLFGGGQQPSAEAQVPPAQATQPA